MNLAFEWFCKEQKEKFDDFDKSTSINYPIQPHPAALNSTLPSDDFKGCFGNGVGKLSGSG